MPASANSRIIARSAAAADGGDGTRDTLLQAATEVFAAQGYELARVREIADRAGANVAAISYHFGSKQALYLAVLRAQAGARIDRYPLPGSARDGNGRAALQAAVAMLLSRFLADDMRAALPKLLMREFLAPTAALETMIDDLIAPQFRLLSTIVAGVLGPRADADEVARSAFSVVSQCMFYLYARPLVQRLLPGTYESGVVERLAAHIARFSFAALRARRRELEAGR